MLSGDEAAAKELHEIAPQAEVAVMKEGFRRYNKGPENRERGAPPDSGDTMAEESGTFEALGKIIPSIYYDLIARVCPGSVVTAALLWDSRDVVGEIAWAKLILLLGMGYQGLSGESLISTI